MNSNRSESDQTKQITYTAMMAALVFVATYAIRIPNPATGGYSHMGDCMVFLAAYLLGKRRGALAGAIGGALSDFFAGAAVWIVPTFFIKFGMAYICGLVLEKKPDSAATEISGSVLGGAFQVAAYTLVKIPLVGMQPAVLSVPREVLQTLTGIVLFVVIAKALENAKVLRRRAAG